jgi:uncharacterized membrane protein
MGIRRHTALHRRCPALAAALVIVALSACSGEAHAQSRWDICNSTPEAIDLAIAFPEGEGLHSRGWFALAPNACQTFNFKSIYREVHWRATSKTRLFPARGNVMLCADRQQPFDIPDARSWHGGCASRHKVEAFYTVPFTGNQMTTRITKDMGVPPPQKSPLD